MGTRKKRVATVLRIAAGLLAAAILLPLLYGLWSGSPLPFYGHGFYTVLTGSMEPAIPAGSLLLVQGVAAEDLREGDILTFRTEGTVLTHRVVSLGDENGAMEIVTRGDANNVDDPPIAPDQVIGRAVWHAAGVGRILAWLRQPPVLIALLILAALLFVLPAGRSRKKKTEVSDG